MIYRIHHVTTYHYAEPVPLCQNIVHLTPRPTPRQQVLRTTLMVAPTPSVTSAQLDSFANPFTFLSIEEPHQQLIVEATHQVDIQPLGFLNPQSTPPWEMARDQVKAGLSQEALAAYEFTFPSRYIEPWPGLLSYGRQSFTAQRPLLAAALDLTSRIHAEFRYNSQATTIATPLQEVFAQRQGVCQDFAHLQIGCLRALGLPARYVSGYVLTQNPEGKPRLVGADASHAWVSIYCPGHGWLDLDPTNNLMPSDQHITLVWGRDYDDVSPIKGIIVGGGNHVMTVNVDVAPISSAELVS